MPRSWPGPGSRPEFPAKTAAGLRQLCNQGEAIRQAGLRPQYYTRHVLHGHRFYMGLCDPLEDTESLIRETAGYIEDTERLAEADPIMARDAARVCAK